MKGEPRFVPAFALLLSGFIAWIAHFGLIYAYTGLICARPGWARLEIGGYGVAPLGIAALTALALAGLAAALVYSRLRSDGDGPLNARFYRHLIWGGALLGAIAITWQGLLSIALTPSCG